MERGQLARDVYLTRGQWRDMLNPTQVYEGGRWLTGFPAGLEVLPCFQRVPPPPPPPQPAAPEAWVSGAA